MNDECPFYVNDVLEDDAKIMQQEHANYHRGATVVIEEIDYADLGPDDKDDEPQTLGDA